MPSKVGTFAISISAWLKIDRQIFGLKGSEVRKDLDNCFADDYKS